ncbi:MAG: DUF2461 domain-containing protein [Archangium sp.]|nr:DUF2461 domain-containing protein [Archangium sp.]
MAPKKPTPAPPAPFTGFPKPGISWFQSLAVAQNREWFQAHKAGYEQLWLSPMQSLLAEVRAPLEKLYGRKLGPTKIFRLNRDVRFSKDKSPYKTNVAGLIPFDGFKPMEGPAALYLHLGLEEVVAFGFYMLEPASLQRLRKLLIDEKTGPGLAKLMAAAQKKGLLPDAMEKLKRPPPGVRPDHPRVELLKHKALALSRSDVPKSVRFGAGLKAWVLEQAKAAAPVVKWGLAQKL